jgi:hypothetical protein
LVRNIVQARYTQRTKGKLHLRTAPRILSSSPRGSLPGSPRRMMLRTLTYAIFSDYSLGYLPGPDSPIRSLGKWETSRPTASAPDAEVVSSAPHLPPVGRTAAGSRSLSG